MIGVSKVSDISKGNCFACTIFTASKPGLSVAVTNKSPTLAVVNASNVLVTNVSFSVDLRWTSSCPNINLEESDRFVCLAVVVYRSYGVQIKMVKGINQGRKLHCARSSVVYQV